MCLQFILLLSHDEAILIMQVGVCSFITCLNNDVYIMASIAQLASNSLS